MWYVGGSKFTNLLELCSGLYVKSNVQETKKWQGNATVSAVRKIITNANEKRKLHGIGAEGIN